MGVATSNPVLSQLLTCLVAIGWVLLVLAGIEPDKPLSGGIPGHIAPADLAPARPECLRDRAGEVVGWLVFGLASLSLPAIVIWVIASHG